MTDQERDVYIAERLGEGLSLGEVQKLLANEFGINMSYFDLRLLAADLPVTWKKQEAPKPPAEEPEPEPQEPRTVVTVNKISRPGVMMSGRVDFQSGASGEWSIDNLGRPSLSLDPESSKPTKEDVAQFQQELQNTLSGTV